MRYEEIVLIGYTLQRALVTLIHDVGIYFILSLPSLYSYVIKDYNIYLLS